MKIVNITVVDEAGEEQVLKVIDGSAILVCEEDKILTQITQNAAINLQLMKKIITGIQE
jgi:hypothetical protein